MADESRQNSVLIVDDENMNIMALTNILNPEYKIYAAKNGRGAISAAQKFVPDIILLDIIMPEMSGYEIIAELKSNTATRDIPVVFISGLTDSGNEEKGLALGAADYISKPFHPAIVKLRVHHQMKMLNQFRTIERLTMRDQLTEIMNRRGLDNQMNIEWIQAERENSLIGLLMIDVDNFKGYNDTYGHQQGDVALHSVAQTVTNSLNHPGDIAARWGGEEFVVLLPNTDLNGALTVAERIRGNVRNTPVMIADGSETHLTVSIGAHALSAFKDSSIGGLIAEADKALYKAKKNGKDRVCHP